MNNKYHKRGDLVTGFLLLYYVRIRFGQCLDGDRTAKV